MVTQEQADEAIAKQLTQFTARVGVDTAAECFRAFHFEMPNGNTLSELLLEAFTAGVNAEREEWMANIKMMMPMVVR